MTTAISNKKILDVLYQDLNEIFKENVCTARPNTIKNFNDVKNFVKTEMRIIDGVAIITHMTGDVKGIFGVEKEAMINKSVVEVLGLDIEQINKVYNDLQEGQFCFKRNWINNKWVYSFIMWRSDNELVEISSNKAMITML